MEVMKQNKDYHSLCVANLPVKSHDAYDIQQKIKRSLINRSADFDQKWQLTKAFNIDNKTFNREFNEKRGELQDKSAMASQCEIRYGYLSTIKNDMIHKVAEEGLEVRLCPYNYFGHSISGVHISQNADVCLNEASKKIGPNDSIILIVFKYMLGNHKIVPMYDPNVLIAPTPNFDSHLCEERPDPTERVNNQYIKSLVYLYEFENPNLDPTIRPRHCCPVAALVYAPFRPFDMVDLTNNDPVPSTISVYDNTHISFMKTAPKSNWGREFLLKPSSLTESPSLLGPASLLGSSPLLGSSILTQKEDRKVLMSEYNETGFHPMQGMANQRAERWEPIQQENGRDRSVVSLHRSRIGLPEIDSEKVAPVGRARAVDRLSQWRGDGTGNEQYIGSSRGFEGNHDGCDQYTGGTRGLEDNGYGQYTGVARGLEDNRDGYGQYTGGVRGLEDNRDGYGQYTGVARGHEGNPDGYDQFSGVARAHEDNRDGYDQFTGVARGHEGNPDGYDQFTVGVRGHEDIRKGYGQYTGVARGHEGNRDGNFAPLYNPQRNWFQ